MRKIKLALIKKPMFLLVLLLSGCKGCDETATPQNKKPEPTTDGRNTFYCEINGKPYYQKFVGGQPSYPTITGVADTNSIYGYVELKFEYPQGGYSENISLTGIRVKKKGDYKIDTSSNSFMLTYFNTSGCSYLNNYRFNSMKGEVKLARFDIQNYIFSGTFAGKIWLSNSQLCDTIRFTNGIFDIKL